MLCAACKLIFQDVYLLGSGVQKEWKQDLESFHLSQKAGCQICNFLWTQLPNHLLTTKLSRKHFPCHYKFELHSADWACFGREPEYLDELSLHDDLEKFAQERAGRALSRYGSDHNVYNLRYLLKNNCQTLLRGDIEMWAVLTFEVAGTLMRFPLQVHRGDPAEELAQLRLAEQSTTESTETLQLGLHWLSECITNHPECKPIYEDLSWHPSRLIYVGTLDQPSLRLTLGSTLPSIVKYATLSHCWGDSQDSIVTKETLQLFFDAIPSEVLSSTAKDAVRVTRNLGLQYLWIDGFCIIQNDKEDWDAESAQMAKVYGFATCTIAAAASRSGDESFLCTNRNQYAVRPCEVFNPFSARSDLPFQISARSLGSVFDEEVKATKWHNRGWVFQERLLSQRLLIFSPRQVLWSCQRLSAAESWPAGRTSRYHIDRFESFEAEKLELHRLLDRQRDLGARDGVWESVVERYTRAEMRESSDRLVALQGIASRVADATGRRYISGLWHDSTLPESLLWRLSTPMIGPARTIHGVASWSWGSVAEPVEFLDDHSRLVETYVHVTGSRNFSRKHGSTETDLEVHGPLFEMTMALHSSTRYFELRRDEYFEVRRRQSIHPGHKFAPDQPSEALESGTSDVQSPGQRIRARLWAKVRCGYTKALTTLRGPIWLLRVIWHESISKPILAYIQSTQVWRQRFYSQYIQPPGHALKAFLLFLLQVLAFLIAFSWELLVLLGEQKYVRPVVSCTKVTSLVLWAIFKSLLNILWYPIWWVGSAFHDDPDWDWILLWNVTTPFPYLFPWIFGPLRARPRTNHEWKDLQARLQARFQRQSEIPVGPSYDEWLAREIPDKATPFLDAECWLDAPIESEKEVQVTCLLVVRRFQIHGLLLRRVDERSNRYNRLGVFKSSKYESCFSWTEEAVQRIILV